jgi:hypothetical protein
MQWVERLEPILNSYIGNSTSSVFLLCYKKHVTMLEQPSPSSTLGGRISTARRRRFVGRDQEKQLFRNALQEAPFVLLHVHGPGGVGKTTLLHEFSAIALEQGCTLLHLDARNIDPSPDGFRFALGFALGVEGNVLEVLNEKPRVVLIIDTYEIFKPLDNWLREVFLPQLSEKTLVVLAGRIPLGEAWQGDVGWRDLIYSLSLRNLRPEESRDYLRRRGIPESQHGAVLEFTHGHPLALSLVVDVMDKEPLGFQPEKSPDIVRSLLERFLQQVPSPLHRAALESTALARVTTEALLATALQLEDAHDYFEWLRGLSFIESGPLGLFPHDLAREALDADLRWRNPDWYAELHQRERSYYTQKLLETKGLEQQRVLIDDVYLHRHNPMVKPFLQWGEFGSVYGERAKPKDIPALLEMVKTHEGPASAKLAKHWFAKQPEGITVYRGSGQEAVGFLLMLGLHRIDPDDIDGDPATKAALNYARRYAPPRPGEDVLLFRFWMSKEVYQDVSSAQSLIFINVVQHYLSHPKLSWSFFPCVNPDFWLPALSYMDIKRIPEADFEVGGKPYAQFAHDWRAMPIPAWLEMLGERELNTNLKPSDLESDAPVPLVVLSQPEFEDAVRNALRDFTRTNQLQHNPLLRSRLLAERSQGQVNALTLQTLLREAAQALKSNPKDEKLYRALERTYLEPAATQEIAAELLDLPFSTYRRHLSSGIDRVVEWLWQQELYGE